MVGMQVFSKVCLSGFLDKLYEYFWLIFINRKDFIWLRLKKETPAFMLPTAEMRSKAKKQVSLFYFIRNRLNSLE